MRGFRPSFFGAGRGAWFADCFGFKEFVPWLGFAGSVTALGRFNGGGDTARRDDTRSEAVEFSFPTRGCLGVVERCGPSIREGRDEALAARSSSCDALGLASFLRLRCPSSASPETSFTPDPFGSFWKAVLSEESGAPVCAPCKKRHRGRMQESRWGQGTSAKRPFEVNMVGSVEVAGSKKYSCMELSPGKAASTKEGVWQALCLCV